MKLHKVTVEYYDDPKIRNNKIRELRKSKGIRTRELTEPANMSRTYLHMIEQGEAPMIEVRKWHAIAKVLCVKDEDLVNCTEE